MARQESSQARLTVQPARPIHQSVDKITNLNLALTEKMLGKIDREWHRRRLPSRSATIRALLAEALEKAK